MDQDIRPLPEDIRPELRELVYSMLSKYEEKRPDVLSLLNNELVRQYIAKITKDKILGDEIQNKVKK